MAVLFLHFLNGLGGRKRFGDRLGRYRARSRCIGHKGKFRGRFGVLRKLQKACIGGRTYEISLVALEKDGEGLAAMTAHLGLWDPWIVDKRV